MHGNVLKDVVLQWGEIPNSVAHTSTNQIIIWGNKAIEIRKVNNGQMMGIFTHKRDQKTKFLNEKNEKVRFFSEFAFDDGFVVGVRFCFQRYDRIRHRRSR